MLLLAAIIAFVSCAVARQGGGPGPGTTPTPFPEGMVLIPGGTFMMGCVPEDELCDDDEKPRHQVTLSSFYMDVHEVAVAEYAQCVIAGVCKEPRSDTDAWAEFFNWKKPGRENHLVNGVDWNDAQTYCQWRQKRLPTEAEFEYALRAGNQDYTYPWGNNSIPPARYGNYTDESFHRHYLMSNYYYFDGYDDGYVGTSPVCGFTRNPYGLCDISGNVREWAADWYGDNYYQSSPSINPQGPSSGWARVVRGGYWDDFVWDLRSSARGDSMIARPVAWSNNLGFRCSRD